MSALRQVACVIKVNLQGLAHRLPMSLATIIGVALVMLVLLGFLSMAHGFRETMTAGGASNVGVILAKGAVNEVQSSLPRDDVRNLGPVPGLVMSSGEMIASAEVPVSAVIASRTGEPDGLTLRGIGPAGPSLRDGFTLTSGRMFAPGSREIIVGRRALHRFRGLEPGSRIQLGPAQWLVVGTFSADGALHDSEAWADSRSVQALFQLGPEVRSLRVRLEEGGLESARAFLSRDRRANLSIRSEREMFAEQASGLYRLLTGLGWPLGIAMAVGALTGALNTMYTSVAMRGVEIATLRALGFGSLATFVGTMAESLVLAGLGGLLGVALAFLVFNNLTASTIGPQLTQIEFELSLTFDAIVQALLLATAIGLVGGALPAWRSARQTIRAGLAGH